VIYYSDESVVITNRAFDFTGACDVLVADPPFDLWGDHVEAVRSVTADTIVAFTLPQHRDKLKPLGTPRFEMVWTYDVGRWVSHSLPKLNHELVLVYGKTGSAYVGDKRNDRTPVDKGRGAVGKDTYERHVWRPRARAILTSHFHHERDMDNGHWSKPVPLLTRLLEWLCPPGGLVVDAFMGTGTTLVAAKSLGQRAIGYDTSEEMCARAAARCSQEVLRWTA
jgi:hypothetical protein